jgi:hypothetical protein
LHLLIQAAEERKAAAARAEVGLAPSASDAELAQAQMRKVKRRTHLPPPHAT